MRRINDKVHIIDVTGYTLWVYNDEKQQPVIMELEDTHFLPLFSTPEKAEVMKAKAGRPVKLKQITDANEFCDSVAGKIRVVVDPVEDPEAQKTRWTELQLDPTKPLPEPQREDGSSV